jgi:NaMN:DMB phosphoribosyltransferase
VATTSFVADDVPDLRRVVAGFDADPTVTDPGFAERSDPALARYVAGEAKEGAGMGGAVALAARAERLECLKNRIVEMLDKIGGRHEP